MAFDLDIEAAAIVVAGDMRRGDKAAARQIINYVADQTGPEGRDRLAIAVAKRTLSQKEFESFLIDASMAACRM